MKRVKTYGPANDFDVPGIELDAAKLVQNAKAHGMKWTGGAFYRDAEGNHTSDRALAKSCCAIGARDLAQDTPACNC